VLIGVAEWRVVVRRRPGRPIRRRALGATFGSGLIGLILGGLWFVALRFGHGEHLPASSSHHAGVRAVVLEQQQQPLRPVTLPDPAPADGQLLLRVRACGVCRTDLHLRDAEIDATKLPVVLGHQIVARTEDNRRVGVPWLGWTDGECRYCRSGRENLCVAARFTGRDIDGGFAELTVADERYCLPLPDELSDEAAAPLLCGGLIGFRALTLAGDATRLGLYGFGSAAHLICQAAVFQGREVFAFTRPGDTRTQQFARELGASWAGGSDERPPEELDAAIIFASAGELVPQALKLLAPGGSVVCAGIHMSDIPSFPYDDLWRERQIRSVANLTRADGHEFLALAPKVPIRTSVSTYPLEQAEQALADLRAGRFEGSAVVVI
jgi:alcohol dehydrogenase, propanol-preferring